MTYLEKVMQAVKFDKELLDLTEQSLAYFKDAVKDGVGSALSDEYCPGFFFTGAPSQDDDKTCLEKLDCDSDCFDCWNQEEEQ